MRYHAHSFLGYLLTVITLPAMAQDVPLTSTSTLHFATPEEARELIGREDRFLTSVSPFDRQSRLETTREVPHDEFVDFIVDQVRGWEPEEVAKLSAVAQTLKTKLEPFQIPLPRQVWLIKTTGREEGNAAYCRQHAIVLPQSKTADPSPELVRLLTHELFHIASTHDARLRRESYALIGFRVVEPIAWPASLAQRKITNPDAPLADAVIDLRVGEQQVVATPILFSKTDAFDPAIGGPFFKYVTFRLLQLEPDGEAFKAAEQMGEPILLNPSTTADFGRQIGKNTGYILHPDEIMADNFVHLVLGTPNLPTPRIISELKKLLHIP